MENTLTVAQPQPTSLAVFGSVQNFESAQRMAQALAASSMVPKEYQSNIPNCLLALEMSSRMGASPFMVMQNLDIIQGRPSFNSKYAIAAANNSGRFSPIRWRVRDIGAKKIKATIIEWVNNQKQRKEVEIQINDKGWTAYATDLATNELLEGPEVTLEMAVLEGWYTKSDSKWKTMPDQMGRYRSAKFFVNMYAPEVLMGFPTSDELQDIAPARTEDADWTDVTHAAPAAAAPPATAAEELNTKAATRRSKTAPAADQAPIVVTAKEVPADNKDVNGQATPVTEEQPSTTVQPAGGDSPAQGNGAPADDEPWI